MRCIREVAFWIGAIAVLLAPPLLYYQTRDSVLASVLLVSTALFTFLTRFDDIQELSLGTLRAKMREAISEAVATTKQVRELAVISARAALTNLIGGSFIENIPETTRFAISREVIRSLHDLGVSDSERLHATAEFRKGLAVVYVREIGELLWRAIEDEERKRSFRDEWKSLGDFSTWSAPSALEVRSFLRARAHTPSPQAEKLLAEYQQFLDTGDIAGVDRLLEALTKRSG